MPAQRHDSAIWPTSFCNKNDVIDYVYDVHGHLITQWNQDLLNHGALQRYADAISGQGAPLDNCFGFVDGTVRPISRPDERQRIVYNGHKRVHALKFQSLSLPNGVIGNLYGPVGEFFFVKKVLVIVFSYVNFLSNFCSHL